jgi:phage major head subunit gpT-like protein
MATLTPQFFQLLEAEEKEVFFQGFTEQALKYPQLFETKNSTKAYEDRIRVAGLGTFATKPEGTPIAFDDPRQGTQVRTVHQTFALGWRATMEMMEDDQFSVMSRMSSELGASARDHQERLAWGLINDAFTGSVYTGLESDTLFESTHTLLKGTSTTSTISNILSPAVALSQTGIESIMNLADTTTSDEGRYVELAPSILLIHPNEQHNAHVLLNTEYKPGSADNDRSTVVSSRSGLTPLAVPYLSSTTRWYMFSPPGKNTLCWNNRKSLTFLNGSDSETLDQKFYGVYRASVMWSEWRGSWGSQA